MKALGRSLSCNNRSSLSVNLFLKGGFSGPWGVLPSWTPAVDAWPYLLKA